MEPCPGRRHIAACDTSPVGRELRVADSFVPLTELMKSVGTGENRRSLHS
ncbi:hypothetical protein ACFC08_08710 [Streptomyces sp. NPDC056112]|nr:hypothetical protein [Streptomyces sp. HYC2]